MKKKSTFLVLGIMTLLSMGFMSCKKETVVQNSTSGAYSLYVNIAPSAWSYDSENKLYYYDVSASGKLPVDFDYSIDGVFMFGGPSTSSGLGNYIYPINGNSTEIDGYYYYFDAASDQSIRIYAKSETDVTAAPTSYMFFNLIFIQPEDLGSISKVNTSNYMELKKAFGLK